MNRPGTGRGSYRHGLTIGELANLIYNEINAKFPCTLSPAMPRWCQNPCCPGAFLLQMIFPASSLPFLLRTGALRAANVSYGEGTMRPFEQFGAPFMESLSEYNLKNGFSNWNDPQHPLYDPAVYIRWQRFISGGKHKRIMFRFHLHPVLESSTTHWHII